jgi:hypothetical protein
MLRDSAIRRWRTARRLRGDIGYRGVVYALACSVLPGRVVRLEWFVMVERRPVDAGPLPSGLRIRWDAPGDTTVLSSLDLTPAEVGRRRGLGDRALICEGDDGRLVGYSWYRRDHWDERGLQFPLAAHEAWAYDLRVAPTREGRRVLGYLSAYSSVALAREGVTSVLAGIDVANRGVLRATLRRGARSIGSVAMARVGPLSIRREDWDGRRARWRLCRGARPVERPSTPFDPVWRDDAVPAAEVRYSPAPDTA